MGMVVVSLDPGMDRRGLAGLRSPRWCRSWRARSWARHDPDQGRCSRGQAVGWVRAVGCGPRSGVGFGARLSVADTLLRGGDAPQNVVRTLFGESRSAPDRGGDEPERFGVSGRPLPARCSADLSRGVVGHRASDCRGDVRGGGYRVRLGVGLGLVGGVRCTIGPGGDPGSGCASHGAVGGRPGGQTWWPRLASGSKRAGSRLIWGVARLRSARGGAGRDLAAIGIR